MPVFMPVQTTADPAPALPNLSLTRTSKAEGKRVEITLSDRICVRVCSHVGLVACAGHEGAAPMIVPPTASGSGW
jgi:hypothetical protein